MSGNQKFDQSLIPFLRKSRSLTQEEFAMKCGLDRSTLAKLETNAITMTPLYYQKILDGLRKIRYSNMEIDACKKMQAYRMRVLGYGK
ncbi:helix-turn-helix domain-containing protein [Priestia megaterium]|uniref:helix-turn-helix domain-containing protein n=1 Tax=Priestia megaterium TaxID=1404 RepID=UPI003A7FAA5A